MYRAILLSCALLGGALSYATNSKRDCQTMAEAYVVNLGETFPAKLNGSTLEGDSIYHVRAMLYDQIRVYEVVVDSNCGFKSLKKFNLDLDSEN